MNKESTSYASCVIDIIADNQSRQQTLNQNKKIRLMSSKLIGINISACTLTCSVKKSHAEISKVGCLLYSKTNRGVIGLRHA